MKSIRLMLAVLWLAALNFACPTWATQSSNDQRPVVEPQWKRLGHPVRRTRYRHLRHDVRLRCQW